MNTMLYVFTSLLLGVLCAIPGLLFGKFLNKKGFVRENPWLIIFITSAVAIGIRMLFPQAPLSIVVLVLLFGSISFYAKESWIALEKGKWWWVKTKNDSIP